MRITVGISSGIAAYKIIDLIKFLKKDHEIRVILTQSAKHMISIKEIEKIIGKNSIYSELFPSNFNIKTILQSRKVDHIEVARNTDLFVIAPATAHLIAKMAHGLSDDFLTTTLLATHAPIMVFPSMNSEMWSHPAVQNNLETIKSYGYHVTDPVCGDLACGTSGIGRLPEPKEIFDEIKKYLNYQQSLKGKKILVTAGGTSEPIDDVRVVTNRSSGKMGLSLAEECLRRGAQVIFLRSKTALQTYLPMKQLTFETSHELEELIRKYIKNSDIVFHTAAVSDFIIDKIDGKIESKNDLKLNLTPALKILNMLKKWNADITLIGFKAIYGDVTDLILKELTLKKNESKADAFVINNIARDDIGFESDENEVDIFFKRNKIIHLPKKSKKEIACEIINTLLTNEILH